MQSPRQRSLTPGHWWPDTTAWSTVCVVLVACLLEPLLHHPSAGALLSAGLLGLAWGGVLALVLGVVPWARRRYLLLLPPALGFTEIRWAIERSAELLVRHGTALAIPIAGLAGLLMAAGTALALQRTPALSPSWRRAVPCVVGVASMLLTLPFTVVHVALLLPVSIYLLFGAAAVVLVFWHQRALLGAAAAVLGAAVLVLPRTYAALLLVSGWLTLLLALLAVLPRAAGPKTVRSQRIALLMMAVTGFLLGDRAWGVAGEISPGTRGGVATVLARSARAVLDWDGDGYGLSYGPVDCAPLNGAIFPGAAEIAGNGLDDNCAFGSAAGDLTKWQATLAPANPTPPAWNADIVMVMVDSLRLDEARSAFAPQLGRFFDHSVFFERAYSTSTFTPESLLGILAARLPSGAPFTWRAPFNGCPAQPPVGLPAALRASGYATALVGPPADTTDCFEPHTFGNGFDVLAPLPYFSTASAVTQQALSSWAALGPRQPRFMFVHYLSVHNAYESREAYRQQLGLWDAAFAELRGAIGTHTLWVLLADHGEEFDERGNRGHANTLFEEVVRVPLAIQAPTLAPFRVTAVSSLWSLPVTLAAMSAANQVLPSAIPGVPYLCLSSEAPCHDQDAPLELIRSGVHLRGLVSGRRKLLHDLVSGEWQAFDLHLDPGERTPLPYSPQAATGGLPLWEEYVFSWQPSP